MRVENIPSAADFEFHEAPTQPQRERQEGRMEGALVLIVDDDVDARAIYESCLQQFGYRTACESSGEDGVHAATCIRPAAILMDAEMPGIGGIEATRRIKADPRTAACPVVMITAHGASNFEEARAAGCDAYFCKPFNVFALDSVMRLLRTPGAKLPHAHDASMVKKCTCGEVYSLDRWLSLTLCGRMHVTDAPNATLELRNCSCGSTLALAVEDP